MKKKFIYSIIIILLSHACHQKLDMEPKNALDSSKGITSIEEAESFLWGAYSELAGQAGTSGDGRIEGGELFGGDSNLFSELLATATNSSGDIRWRGTFKDYEQFFFKELTADNLIIRNNWLRAYHVINMCNQVLDALEKMDAPEDELKGDNLEGEAKFIRAVVYFELIRFFAQPWVTGESHDGLGVPLILTPTYSLEDVKPIARASISEVYAQIITDLESAETFLPEENEFRANTFSASAMLARVYLQQSEFALARDKANKVITEGNFGLVPRYKDAFNKSENTDEDIFAIQQNAQTNAGINNSGLATFYGAKSPFGLGRGDIQVRPSYLGLFEDENDTRGSFFVEDANRGRVHTLKWAECNVRLEENVGDTPLNDLNKLKDRAEVENKLVISPTLEDVLKERRLELAFEGQALHDLKRLQLSVAGLDYNAPELVLPIPQREIDVSGGVLEQNVGH
jgi:starch-binding outer membrane protein, SusD/RagB family